MAGAGLFRDAHDFSLRARVCLPVVPGALSAPPDRLGPNLISVLRPDGFSTSCSVWVFFLMFLGEAEGLVLHYTKGFGHRAFCHPRVPPVFGCSPHPLTPNIFTSDLDLSAAAQQTPLGLVPGEISVQQKLSGGGGGSLLHPTLMAAVGRCSRAAESPQGGGTLLDDARPVPRTELGLLEKGGSCLPPPITAYLSEPESPRQRGREQVPPRPSAWSSPLRRCFLQSGPLLFFPIAFGNPTKSIPRVRTFVIFTIF